jgi:NADH-quinone oxidoreductase subunit J
MVVTARNPVTAAVFLVVDLFLLAGVYAMQGADFIAAIQVIIYAGAVVVLFLFVIMLLNIDPTSIVYNKIPVPEFFVLFLTILGFLGIALKLFLSEPTGISETGLVASEKGNTYDVGIKLFTEYLWPFELASILILLAVVASVLIARKKKKS